MRLGLKNTLAYIATIGVIGLSGCEKNTISQESVNRVTEKALTTWVDTTDNYIEINRLLKKGEYKKAKVLVGTYLQHERKQGLLTKGALESGSLNISPSLQEEALNIIKYQTERIDSSLR